MAKRSSEKAWVERHRPTTFDRPSGAVSPRQPFLTFVRYMRWYTSDARSYILRRLDPPAPFDDTRHYPRWPRREA